MSYDEWNRLASTHSAAGQTTFTYYGDGMKRTEQDANRTTLVWDGDDYLQGRS